MEPEQPDPTALQPQRRWYEDLSHKLKQKISKSSRSGSKSRPNTPNLPTQSSSVHSANLRSPSPRNPSGSGRASPTRVSQVSNSRPPTPPSGRPSNSGSYDTAWRTLEATLHGLQENVELAPPLRAAIDGLASFLNSFEAATKHHQDYQKIASDLNITLQSLKQHLADSTSMEMTEIITDILRAIQEEIGSTEHQQTGNTPSRVLTATLHEEDLARQYHRIEQLFCRLQLEISMGGWHTENIAQTRARLQKLWPARLAAYGSGLSVDVDRRTCTENTRKGILHNLNKWSSDPDAKKIFWMDGMAGTGKTTIAYTLCQVLQSRGQLAASFFCTRTSPECITTDKEYRLPIVSEHSSDNPQLSTPPESPQLRYVSSEEVSEDLRLDFDDGTGLTENLAKFSLYPPEDIELPMSPPLDPLREELAQPL
ncbi:Protein translocase subunit SecA [Ceratobasidium theobromae]|uniref:Protein translocase subunit SecA n=1 Tax=Ceratobasidium theobromae TaxID=1582974 RepID=A0A5N5Q8J4_9AGAM|nr:Protein translocase subunit SecA [Ceratobasidium theobromae]